MAPRQSAAARSDTNRRAYWLTQLRQWHWISAAVSLFGILLFAATGITLNHASQIEAKPVVEVRESELPDPVRAEVGGAELEGGQPLPPLLTAWLAQELGIKSPPPAGEWSKDEIYVSLPRPGGDAWISIDRGTGEVRYESTDRGWVSYLNDLHKGRNTGWAWNLFIDVFAVACVLFSLTGLALLQLYAANRSMTWPLVSLGCVLPIVVIIFLIH